jgi:transcriptional regulator
LYVPSHFAQNDRDTQLGVIRAHPFGILTSLVDGHLMATHIPFLVEGDALHAHVARANPHWRAFDGATEAQAVFSGPHAYVSPTWYEKRPAVPTWNYVAVHVTGRPQVIGDPAAARPLLARLVATFDSAWRMDDEPETFLDGMMKGIVAFRLPIERIEGKFKLSQNRDAADRQGAAARLRELGARDLAQLMEDV